MMARLGTLIACFGLTMGLVVVVAGCWCEKFKGSSMTRFSGLGYLWGPR